MNSKFGKTTHQEKTCLKHGKFNSIGFLRSGRPYVKQCPQCEAEEQKARVFADKKVKVDENLSKTGIPNRYRNKTFSEVIFSSKEAESAFHVVSGYVKNFSKVLERGASGFFSGECGTGKTMFACLAVNGVVHQGFTARYITAWNMIQEIRIAYSHKDVSVSQQVREFISKDLLVIDEIGVQAGSNDERALLYQVIDGRYNEVKPTILISNSKNPVEDGYLDARTIDRLKEGGGFSITFNGESYRK